MVGVTAAVPTELPSGGRARHDRAGAGAGSEAEAQAEAEARAEVADRLLSTMASIRRSGRRQSGRPVELAELNGSQLELVRLVLRRPGVSVADAAEKLRLAPNTVSTLVGQLTEKGMLLRLADTADRRVARLDLAPATRRRVAAWRDRRVVALADAAGRLAPAERRRLAAAVPLLARLADELAQGDRAQGERPRPGVAGLPAGGGGGRP